MVKKLRKKIRKETGSSATKRIDIDLGELQGIVAKASTALTEEEAQKLSGAVDTLAVLTQELEEKGASIQRLRHLIFGAKTEKTSTVLADTDGHTEGAHSDNDGEKTEEAAPVAPADLAGKTRPKRNGHGRNGADQYTGAQKIKVPHETLKPGDPCPELGCDGKAYPLATPKTLVRVKGIAPLMATVWELEQLRCNLCGVVFTATAPEDLGDEKYDETAASMVGLLKYGCGVPFNRLDKLEKSLGIPLPSSTQWDIVEKSAKLLLPAYSELIRQAAQGELVHNDDTVARILELMGMRHQANQGDDATGRTGLFTTGIVSLLGTHRIAAFFTGRQHAGENLADLLAQRAAELVPPIQMCDALSRNLPEGFVTILANCIAHARRKFVEVADTFPDETRQVLEALRDVYRNDALATKQVLSPEARLAYHQEHSGPIMADLEAWLKRQFDERLVEPNSSLGGAIKYMHKHWEKLTLFLRKPGAPLDNNLVERALKRAILHRKNALFYKTENGARVGDLFMTLIHTCELEGVNPFDYLVAVQRHAGHVGQQPDRWMPWSYRETLASLDVTSTAPQ